MIFFMPVFESETKERLPLPKYDGAKMSLDMFLNHSFEEFGYKYEWNQGVLEARTKVKENERYIYRNIHRKFIQTRVFAEGFDMISEADCNLKSLNKLRRPDISIFSKIQIENPEKSQESPEVVIEILSPSNSIIEETAKLYEFFQTGAKVVWQIYPSLQEVKVYYSTKQVKICTGNDLCDGGKIIPDFQMSVNEIFSTR
jgi:Uma2 family endonuclease